MPNLKEKEIENNETINFEYITSYLEKYAGEQYYAPQKQQANSSEMAEFKEHGRKAVQEFRKYIEIIASNTGYIVDTSNNWINQAQKGYSYFWGELKKHTAQEYPHSLSVAIYINSKNDSNDQIILSLSVETKDTKSKPSDYEFHNKIINFPIQQNTKIYYQADFNIGEQKNFRIEEYEEVKKALKSKIIKKLKVVRNIIGPYTKNNTSKIIQDSLEAAKELIPFYEYILQERGIDTSNKNGTNKEKVKMEDVRIGLNTILYGPPGTGKTYNTVSYAVALCDNEDLSSVKAKDYKQVLQRYNELVNEERIAFTTFHQSYSYEEFIEGIRPVIDNDINEDNPNIIEYELESGVFKDFCEKAERATIKSSGFPFPIAKDAKVWKVTVYDTVIDECFKKNQVRIGFDIKDKGAISFVNNINTGDIILTTNGSREYINGIAIATSDEAYEQDDVESNKTTRNVTWLACNIHEDITPLNKGLMMARHTVSKLPNMNVTELIEFAIQKNPELRKKQLESNTKPYVFIIDEINRGNISKIFGELITLIEDTKRKGMPEQISAILPYSGHKFSVPSNVYIIGTMNTADRSIALMDTALRRRFQFVEMMPDSNILKKIGADKVDDLDVALMLDKINERITFLYDREHTIGHAFFTKLAHSPDIKTLEIIFDKTIIPLLQEYFYEDYQKIQLVLGDNGKTNDDLKFIQDEKIKVQNIFKGNIDDVVDLPEKKFKINKVAFSNIESYKQII